MTDSDIEAPRSAEKRPDDTGGGRTVAVVLLPILPERDKEKAEAPGRDPASRLAEAVGLAQAIDLDIQAAEAFRIRTPMPATLFGGGQVAQAAAMVEGCEATLVVVDGVLSPVQQRNLEREWKAKVIDRTGLILEIFGARARTHEGRLQVELASLTYQRSRLVRSWTHLERQRGGFGFLGGPGESQLELDRRLIGDRIAKLKRELEEVKRTRELHRGARKRVPYPIVALVGYTNAGKSTLFNRLTRATVMAEDLLFATLDPTMRGLSLPSGRRIILSDTVGFISQLPTHLVAAFRATLEEVLEADLLIHVRDLSHPDTDAQKHDVEGVLTDLGLGEAVERGLLEAWNKSDRMPEEERAAAAARATTPGRESQHRLISALTGDGCDALLTLIDAQLGAGRVTVTVMLDLADGKPLAWLHEHGEVTAREDDVAGGALVTARLDPINVSRFWRLFPELRPADAVADLDPSP